MKAIVEIKMDMNNNESLIKGVYLNEDGTYTWMTFTRSGVCKKLITAKKKIGL